MAQVVALWRHPIKSHGREAVDSAVLKEGQTFPWDRTWAVLHDAAKASGTEWAHCANFTRGSKAPGLMAISAVLDEESGRVTLSHPDRPDLTFDPDTEGERLIEWSRPLVPTDRAASARVVRPAERGMTDTDFPSVSIGNMATLRAVSQKMGRPADMRRWRINIWLDGLAPWEEFDLLGREIRIGGATLHLREPITRCLSTAANPDNGLRDVDTLGTLETWGHRDMGVHATVTTGGKVALNDEAIVI